jgi:hypothetical protein
MLSGILLLLGTGFQPLYAQSGQVDQVAARVRTEVSKLRIGKNAHVEVKLRDDTKLKGYISETSEDSFTVADSKTGASRTVAYTDVAQVKKSGGGISMKTWGIIAAAAAGAVVTWIVVKPVLCDGGAQSRGPC